ncbi:hypothetical protein B4Q13_24180, partial [Lacticaseibacillus rhamnosus]
DRPLAGDPDIVAVLGRAGVEGTLAGGVLPVIKHVPGHGRARADSHLSLPCIEAEARALEAGRFPPLPGPPGAPPRQVDRARREVADVSRAEDRQRLRVSPRIHPSLERLALQVRGNRQPCFLAVPVDKQNLLDVVQHFVFQKLGNFCLEQIQAEVSICNTQIGKGESGHKIGLTFT